MAVLTAEVLRVFRELSRGVIAFGILPVLTAEVNRVRGELSRGEIIVKIISVLTAEVHRVWRSVAEEYSFLSFFIVLIYYSPYAMF